MIEKKLAAMQPYFFPYIGYFQAIAAADTMILYDLVQYIDRGWINRNRILYNYSSIEYFGVPVKKPGNNLIKDVRILYGKTEQNKLLKILYLNYRRATFFNETYPVIEQAVRFNTDFISNLNSHSLQILLNHLGVRSTIISSCDQFEEIENILKSESVRVDYRTGNRIEVKTSRILHLCHSLGYTSYINPIGGIKLYNKEIFASEGISLQFIRSNNYHYLQKKDSFVKDLSIIDVLMHCGKESTSKLLSNYTFV